MGQVSKHLNLPEIYYHYLLYPQNAPIIIIINIMIIIMLLFVDASVCSDIRFPLERFVCRTFPYITCLYTVESTVDRLLWYERVPNPAVSNSCGTRNSMGDLHFFLFPCICFF